MGNGSVLDTVYNYIDKHRSIEYIWAALTILALIIGLFVDTSSLLANHSWILVLIFSYLLGAIWLFLGRRIYTLKQDVVQLRNNQPRLLELQQLISGIVAQHKINALYEIEKWIINYHIDEQGNTQYSRHVSYRLSPQIINLFVFKWGTNTQSAMDFSETLQLKTYFTLGSSNVEHPLDAIPYEYYAGGIRFVCLIPYQKKNDQLVTVHISGHWKGMYEPLVLNGHDRNTIDIFTPTKKLEIALIAPTGKVFTGLEMTPPVIGEVIEVKKQSPSSVIYKAQNIPKGNYEYTFHWEDQ